MCHRCVEAKRVLDHYFQTHDTLDKATTNLVADLLYSELMDAADVPIQDITDEKERGSREVVQGLDPDDHDTASVAGEKLMIFLTRTINTRQGWQHFCRPGQSGCLIGYCLQSLRHEEITQLKRRANSVRCEVRICGVRPAGDGTLIETVEPHGLTGGETLEIKGSNCLPSLDKRKWKPGGKRRRPGERAGWYLLKGDREVELSTAIGDGVVGARLCFGRRRLTTSLSGPADQPGVDLPDSREAGTLFSILGISYEEFIERLESVEDHQILILRYREGRPLAEVAAITGLTVSRIRTIEERAVARLRTIFNEQRPPDERF